MKSLLIAAVILLHTTFAAAQTAVTPEMRRAADDAYQKQDWKTAAREYEKIVNSETRNAAARYRYGIALLGLAKFAEARTQFEAVLTAAPNPTYALALARVFARTGDKLMMYEMLEKSISLGGIPPELLNAEKDFDGVRGESRFAEIIKKSDLAANPCKASPEHRQFDFWIGEWNVRNAQGLSVGTSSIQLILGDCVIFENWNTPAYRGKSFNVFNRQDGKWHQSWFDDNGTVSQYVGSIVDGKMILIGETPGVSPKTLLKMTFSKLPDGDVRQLGEASADDGKTWQPRYDFVYERKPK